MRTLLVINDNSCEAKHASVFALTLAQKMQANIILASALIKQPKAFAKVTAGNSDFIADDNYPAEQPIPDMGVYLKLLMNRDEGFKPEIEEFDISEMDENQVAAVIIKNNVWMIVKGTGDVPGPTAPEKKLNIHTILNKVLCPLMLIPANWQIKEIERMVYITDLRYCRIQIVRYLANLASPWHAGLLIAHLSSKGLPDMAENYALNVFNDEVRPNVKYDQLFFNNIKEKDLTKAVDVIINGMHNDVLVVVNHRFHFEEIVGRYITNTLPLTVSVPLLIFPY